MNGWGGGEGGEGGKLVYSAKVAQAIDCLSDANFRIGGHRRRDCVEFDFWSAGLLFHSLQFTFRMHRKLCPRWQRGIDPGVMKQGVWEARMEGGIEGEGQGGMTG